MKTYKECGKSKQWFLESVMAQKTGTSIPVEELAYQQQPGAAQDEGDGLMDLVGFKEEEKENAFIKMQIDHIDQME